MIVDPIMHLKKASKELEVGSNPVKVSQAVKGGELGDLAHAFDQMADTLIQRETALRESESKANALIRYAPTGICEIDYRGPKFISVNDVMCQILGYSREELISMGPGAILEENSRVILADRVRRQLAGEKIEESVEYRVRKKDGSFIDTILNISLNLVEGEPWRALVIVHDITERKRAEEEVRKSAEVARAIFDATTESVFLIDLTGTVLSANSIAAQRLGCRVEDMIGHNVYDLLPEDVGGRRRSYAEEVIRTGKAMRLEDERSGRWIDASICPVFDSAGNVSQLAIFARDITEHKKAEEALRQREALLQAILDNSPDPIYLKDRESRLLLANPATFSVVGKPPEAIIGKTDAEFYDDPSTGRAIMENDRRIMSSEKMEVVEESIFDPAGTRVYLSTKAPYRDAEGRIIGLIGVAREITGRKKAEELLRKGKKELEFRVQEGTEELAKSQERLKGLASQLLLAQEKERKRVAMELHDGLLSELAATKYLLEGKMILLKKGNLSNPGELERVSDVLTGAIKEARRIMNNLHPSVLDELGLIAAMNWLSGEYQKSYPHIRVQQKIEVSEEDISDKLRIVIYRVLQEALNNFAKHGKGDRVDLSLLKLDNTFTLTIRDNGQGFDIENAVKGLGLESMRERVELSGGNFIIESVRSAGTTIRASWPLPENP